MELADAKAESFAAIFESRNPASIKAAGCHEVKLYKDKENEHCIFTISIWESEEALNTYRDSSFFKTTWSMVKPMLSKKAQVWSLESVTQSQI